jgi:hypothetical protein
LRRYEAGFSVAEAVTEANERTATRLGLSQTLVTDADLVEGTRAVFSGNGSLTLTAQLLPDPGSGR